MKYVVKLTMKEAESLGIVVCTSCGYPKNNHFSFAKKLGANTDACSGWKPRFSKGAPIRKAQKPKARDLGDNE